MHIHNFAASNSVLKKYIAELRAVSIQKDAWRFRHNIERIGAILGYELSKSLSYYEDAIQTPYGVKNMSLPDEQLVVCAILRAGLPLHSGVLSCFDNAENGFISAYRKRQEDGAITTITEYLATPDLNGKTLILCDPMIATGSTLQTVYDVINQSGTPKAIHIVAVIGSKEGIDSITKCFPEKTHLWITAIDEELSAKKYIIPGLGDAGDLSFGVKQ
jgi:uracil phosphoribosyltransferase